MEYKELSVYQKLQIVRDLLNNCQMPKTGKNTFSHYNYYQLSDFMPFVQRYCKEVGICSVITFDKENEEAVMKIVNCDKPDEIIEFKIRYIIPQLKGANTAQMVGGMSTYFSRYLYQIAFAITENDAFDGLSSEENIELDKDQTKKDELINEIKKNIKNENVKTALTEVIKKQKAKSITDLTLSDLQEIVDLI